MCRTWEDLEAAELSRPAEETEGHKRQSLFDAKNRAEAALQELADYWIDEARHHRWEEHEDLGFRTLTVLQREGFLPDPLGDEAGVT